ncbi:hypothetical protein FOC1_g10001050 [Fusarium oxysporum f. sp. cubense race 1]|uniref:Uncharacterized protein n=1 Tax=Fusarium oxysporum f. sp. cubense (strain race 1) TaxID=1229664 RepID=N4UIC1_FUSC1|nr:hypothetical protein FOC1_g10001050 [Fusarium oxysporum f. sp. cubense race 1]
MSGQIPSLSPSKEYIANSNREQTFYTDYPPAHYQMTPSFFDEPGTYPHSDPSNKKSISLESGQSSLADMAPIWSPCSRLERGDGLLLARRFSLQVDAIPTKGSSTNGGGTLGD